MISISSILLLFNPLAFALGGLELLVIQKPSSLNKLYIKNMLLFFMVFSIIYYIKTFFILSPLGSIVIYTMSFIVVYDVLDRIFKISHKSLKVGILYFLTLFSFLGLSIINLPFDLLPYLALLAIFMGQMLLSYFIIIWVRQYYYLFLYKNTWIQESQNMYLLIILSIILYCNYLIMEIIIR